MAGDGAGGVDDLVQPVGDEPAGRLVVARLRPALEQQRGGRRAAAGDGEQIAREAPLATLERLPARVDRGEDRAGHGLAAERADDGRAAHQLDPGRLDAGGELAAAGVRAQVGDGDDADAGVLQRERGVEPAVAGRGHDGGVAGLDGVERGEPAGAARQHHAGQVVVGEDERLLERAGRGDVARGADLVQRVALPHGDEPVEEPERGRAAEDLDAGRARLLGQGAGALVAALVQQRAARLDVLVGEHHVRPGLGRAQRGASPAIPPPITRMSQWRRRYSVRHSRSSCFFGRIPRPATERSTFS